MNRMYIEMYNPSIKMFFLQRYHHLCPFFCAETVSHVALFAAQTADFQSLFQILTRLQYRAEPIYQIRVVILCLEAKESQSVKGQYISMCPAGILYVWPPFLRQSTAYTSLYPLAPFHLSVSISCILMSLGTGC